jgi:hypothetical protein
MKREKTGDAKWSEDKRKRRALMKNIIVRVPTTKGLTRNNYEAVVIENESAEIKDIEGRVIIRVWNEGAKNYAQELWQSTKALENKVRIRPKKTKRSDVERTMHVGSWRKSSPTIQLTKDTEDPARHWMQRNAKFWSAASNLFYNLNRNIYETYDEVEAPLKLGVWTTCTINFDFGPIKAHFDNNDYQAGYCFVVPFGNFTGGDLVFTGINITIKMQPGMVVAFKSYELEHAVTAYEGERYSIVLHSPQTGFHATAPK